MQSNKKIDFFIIGAKKAASTFTHNVLASHDEIYMPPVEVSLFQGRHYSDKKLLALLESMPESKLLGIKRPVYLYDYDAARLIKNHNPAAKLVVVLRDPVERSISDYYHAMNNALIPCEDIETGMYKVINGDYSNRCPYACQIIMHSMYSVYLNMFYSFFSKEQVLILRQEKIKEESQKEMDRLFSFLGIDSIDVTHMTGTKYQNVVYNMKYIKWLNLLRRMESHTNEKGIVLQKKSAVFPLKKYFLSRITNYIYSRNDLYEKKPLSPGLRKLLGDQFTGEYQFLQEIDS